jgi:hypothetical protein
VLVEKGDAKRTVTPLLIRLFIDQAVKLRKAGETFARLPKSIPETMLAYLQVTNPQDEATPNFIRDDVIVTAVQVLGWCSLEPNYIPQDFSRREAELRLQESAHGVSSVNVIDRLIKNGVLTERSRAGSRLLRFSLDPLAEYMTALHWLNQLWTRARLQNERDEAAKKWAEWLSRLQTLASYPKDIGGFLLAMEDCVYWYGQDFQIPPDIRFPWHP